MTDAKMIPGKKFILGGVEWEIPALTIKQVKQLEPTLLKPDYVNDALGIEALNAAATLVHTAILRNYPEVTLDQVEEMVDLVNIVPIIQYLTGQADRQTARLNQTSGNS
jgi:hypothetical protein